MGWTLLAQSQPGGEWAGFAGGLFTSAAMAGLVFWLLKVHFPALLAKKDDQIAELIAKHEAQLNKRDELHQAHLDKRDAMHEAQLAKRDALHAAAVALVTEHCDREIKLVAGSSALANAAFVKQLGGIEHELQELGESNSGLKHEIQQLSQAIRQQGTAGNERSHG